MRLVDKIWWFRFGLAFAAAALTAYLNVEGFFEATKFLALFLAVGIYILSYVLLRYVFAIKPEQLPKRRDLALQGVFAYIVVWFAFWVFFHTMIVRFMM